jgi:hypothetical protein
MTSCRTAGLQARLMIMSSTQFRQRFLKGAAALAVSAPSIARTQSRGRSAMAQECISGGLT